jgi:hypothetical protein
MELLVILFTVFAILEEIMSGLIGIIILLDTGLGRWLLFLVLQLILHMRRRKIPKILKDCNIQTGKDRKVPVIGACSISVKSFYLNIFHYT